MSWQPIETAPKDGTGVLVCCPAAADGSPVDAEVWGLRVQVAAWWPDEGAWIVYCSLPSDPVLHFTPTHWMPLPANPLVDPPGPSFDDLPSASCGACGTDDGFYVVPFRGAVEPRFRRCLVCNPSPLRRLLRAIAGAS